MQIMIELMLLAAAVDGNIDDAERNTILRCLAHLKGTEHVSEAQIFAIKQQLLDRLQNGQTREGVIQAASLTLDHTKKILSYAFVVEVTLSNNELTDSEIEYLNLHRSILGLDPDEVESIHFSAKLRYGFGDFG